MAAILTQNFHLLTLISRPWILTQITRIQKSQKSQKRPKILRL